MWLDHAVLTNGDFGWVSDVERLTLWNVSVPEGFLARLTRLWWVDWRGGGASQDIAKVCDCKSLRYLSLNQIRGLADVSFLASLPSLEFLTLYGLSKLEQLPSLGGLTSLRRVEIGQMRSLRSIAPVLDAPNLEELLLSKLVAVGASDVTAIQAHPKLKAFSWFAEDVPNRLWAPVREAISLPDTPAVHPEQWFGLE